MNIWLVLWIVLSLTLLGFLGWTLLILFRQKMAWKAYAEKHKLRYQPGKFVESPQMDGMIDGYQFSFFTSEHTSSDIRNSRKMTAVEVVLNGNFSVEGGVASAGMIPVLKSAGFKLEVSPEHEGWSKAYLAQADNRAAMEMYLSKERVQVLSKLMGLAHVWVVFIFRTNMALLRIDTPSAIDSAQQLESLVKILGGAARILELKDGESKLLKAEEAKAPIMEKAVEVDEKVFETTHLQLEDEDGEAET